MLPPTSLIAMQSPQAIVRLAVEECSDELDNPTRPLDVSQFHVLLYGGSKATVRCTRTKKGDIRITILAKDLNK
jgi:hypothetical protein